MTRIPILSAALLLGISLFAGADQTYTLNDLVHAGLSGNPDIEKLVSGKAYNAAGLTDARSSLFPTVTFQNSYTYIANPPAYNISKGSLGSIPAPSPPYPAGTMVSIPQTDITVPEELDHWNINLGIQIQQPIFLWGKIRHNIAMHTRMLQSDAVQIEKKQADVRTMITVQYYSLYYLRQLHRIISDQQKTAGELFRIAQDSFKAGQINEADLTEKQMAFRRIDHAIVDIEDQEHNALISLRAAASVPDLSIDSISFAGVDTALDSTDIPGTASLVDEALGNNADLKLLTITSQIREERLGVARAGTLLKPDLSLTANVTYGGPRLPLAASDWTSKDNFGGNISLVIGASLFDGGKSAAGVAQAKSELDQTAAQTQSAERDVRSYVERNRYELDVDRKNIAYYEGRVTDTEKLVAYQKHLLDIGAGSRLDYYQRRVDLFTERAHVLEQKLGFANRYFTLMNVAGKM